MATGTVTDSTNPLAAYQAQNQTKEAAKADEGALSKLSEDYNTFLTLLTTQLQNQDPLDPMDSAQFTQQLVAFSGVEQQIKANDQLAELIKMQQSGAAQQALSYLGKIVEVDSKDLSVVNKQGAFSYTFSDVANNVKIEIMDSSGNVVRTVSGSGSLGKHQVVWDGKTADGTQLPDGVYTLKVSGTKSDGKAITASTTTFANVSAVETTAEGTSITAGYYKVSPDKILSVHEYLLGSDKVTTPDPTPPADTADNGDTEDDTTPTDEAPAA
jgi:flagellar basal-body rod modification protein FlgD